MVSLHRRSQSREAYCPLAPLLFILAVDLLYDELDLTAEKCGVDLVAREGIYRLHLAGYADDTAIYIRDLAMQERIIEAVKRFSACSGLQVNDEKSIAISIGKQNTQTQSTSNTEGPIATQPACRYLGHWAGETDTTPEAWQRAFAALTARLSMATDKTNSIIQRIDIANSIIIPKLLYVAQHAWPTCRIVRDAENRIRNFIWNSSFALPMTKLRGWASCEALELPRNQGGGLAFPNLLFELHALSAQVIGEWALTISRIVRIVGDILNANEGSLRRHINPSWRMHPPISLRMSIRATGSIWVSRSITPHFADNLISLQSELRSRSRADQKVTAQWVNGALLCDMRALLPEARYLAQLQFWNFFS